MGSRARLVSLRAVEEELSLTAAQVDELVRTGALPVVRILDVWRVESAALDRLIEEARERSGADATPVAHSAAGDPTDLPVATAASPTGGSPTGPAARAGQGSPPSRHAVAPPRTVLPARRPRARPDPMSRLPPVPGPVRHEGGPAPAPTPAAGPTLLARLTAQQRRVLTLVGLGLSNPQIAARLTLEVSTVKSHVQRLLRALDLPDRGHLIAFAWQTGLLRPPADG